MIGNPFIWGRGGKITTPEQAQRENEIARSLLERASDTSPVGHWTAALNRGLQGAIGGMRSRQANEAESAGTESALERFRNRLTGASSPVAEALAGGGSQTYTAPSEAKAIRDGLIARGLPEHIADGFIMNFQDESGLNPGINEIAPLVPGSRGGFGLYQLTGPRRRAYEAYAAEKGVNPADVDAQLDWLMYELQGPEAKAAQSIFAAQNAGEAGAAIVNNFLRPAPEHRTSRANRYLGVGAGISSGPSPRNVSQIAELLADPWLPKDAKAVLQAEMSQQMQMQNAAYEMQLQQQDPMRQLEMQRAQLELDQLRNPGRPKPIEVGGVLLDAETFQPIFDSRSAPGAQSAAGKIQADLAAGFITPEQAELAFSKLGNQTNVTTNLGGDKYWDKVGENQAAAFSEMSASGFSAAQNLGNLDRLESLLAQGPSGASAALQNLAASYGIPVGSAGPLQAANALIQAMIPAQRPPGSGPMSDKDIEMFKASLPRLINSPEGNALIIQTLRGIAQYDMQRAEIADRAMLPPEDPNHLPRNEASRMLRQLRSPLSDFGKNASQFKAESQDAGVVRFETMEDLLNADITSMTDDEMDAWEARMKELQNGGN